MISWVFLVFTLLMEQDVLLQKIYEERSYVKK